MPINFSCPYCGNATLVDERFAGQSGPCGKCGKTISIPTLAGGPGVPVLSSAEGPVLSSAEGPLSGVPRKRASAGMIVGIIAGILLLCGGGCGVGGWFIYGLFQEQQAQRRESNQLHQLTIEVQNYHDVNNQIPPSAVLDKNGKPLYSWRVLLLPHIEQRNLYDQFHLDEPWDSEHNKQFIGRMPEAFRGSPDLPEGKTNLLAVVGAQTALQPSQPWDGEPQLMRSKHTFGSVIDGLSNTAWLVQVPTEKAVIWTAPDDYECDKAQDTSGLGMPDRDWFLAARLDGTVTKVKKTTDWATLKAFFGCNDRTPFMLP